MERARSGTRRRLNDQSSLRPGTLALAICTGVLWTDVALKHWAENALAEPVLITSWLCLRAPVQLGVVSGHASRGPRRPSRTGSFLGAAILGLLWRTAAGAQPGNRRRLCSRYRRGLIGNAVDRVNGGVVDFLGFGPVVGEKWAFANLADFAMLVGMLVLGMVLIRGRADSEVAPAK